MNTSQDPEAIEQPKSRAKLPLYSIFAMAISVIWQFSLSVTLISLEFGADHPFSLKYVIIGVAVAVLSYASGGYVLGTLTRGLLRTWQAAIIFITPSVVLHLGVFARAFMSEAARNDLVTEPGKMIVLPILPLLVAPFASFCSIRLGEDAAGKYNRPRSVLNIPWYHWLWILPCYLFQVVGVPAFFLLTLWRIDLILEATKVFPSLLNLPAFFPRIVLVAIISGVGFSINSVYSTLSETNGKYSPVDVLKVLGNWLLLTDLDSKRSSRALIHCEGCQR
jgi:hypothetical protein